MNILIFTTDYKPRAGGIAEHCYNVANSLSYQGAEVTMLSVKKSGWREFDKQQKFKTYRTLNIPYLRNMLFLFYLFQLCMKRRIDYVYCGITHPCAEVALIFSALLPVKLVVAVHGYEVAYTGDTIRGKLKNIIKSARAFVYNHCHRIVAVSNYTRENLIESGVRPEKIKVVPNGVDTAVFRPGEQHRDIVGRYQLSNKKIILTVGTLTERKGHDVVIKALPQVLREVPELVYLIPGTGPRKDYLENLVAEMNLQNQVIFLGYVPKNELVQLYNTCDVFIMVSKKVGSSVEGFGIVFLEANACKKPVIGGRSGGVIDAVEDGETGLLVDPENFREIAAGLIRLLKNEELSQQLGQKGYERVHNELNWNRVVSGMVQSLRAN